MTKNIAFREGVRHRMTWFLEISLPDGTLVVAMYLTPEEAKKLFDLMKEAGF